MIVYPKVREYKGYPKKGKVVHPDCPFYLYLVSVLFQYFLFLLRLNFRSGYGPNLFTTASRRSLLYFRSSFNLLPLHSEKNSIGLP